MLAEIPNSHPCYLLPGCYMLPDTTALTRRIIGIRTANTRSTPIYLRGIARAGERDTAAGQADVLAVSADANQVRFTPAAAKSFAMTLSRQVGSQARAIAITGAGGGPAADIDVSLSPDLSLLRLGNRGAARSVQVKAFSMDQTKNRRPTGSSPR